MNFLGYLIAFISTGLLIFCFIRLFKTIVYEGIYKEIYLPKKYERDLVDKVRWITIQSYMGSIFINDSKRSSKEVRDRELYKYIEREQHKLNLEMKFCINFSNEKEKNFICKILESHKQSVIESFFYKLLIKDEKFFNMDFLEYYMFSLQGFLREQFLKSDNFNNIVLYNYLRNDESYRTYKLTDYGIIYKKLYYITTLFCVNNENITTLVINSKRELNSIKENLEHGEITFWSYRP